MRLQKSIDRLLLRYKKATKWRLREQAQFFNRLCVLMQEGYLFPQALAMLLPHHIESHQDVQRQIDDKLRQGVGVAGILETLQLSKQHLVAITVAENNGHMIEALEGIAKQLAVNEQTKKKLLKLLAYPIALTFFLLLLFFVFRTVFLPNIEKMTTSRTVESEPAAVALSNLLLHVPDVVIVVILLTLCLIGLCRLILTRQPIAKQLTILLKIPFLQRYFRLTLTRQFAAYLGSLLQSGFSLQASLQILEEQQLQPFLQNLSQRIKERVIFGESLAQAVMMLAVFQKDFPIFIEHGEQSGYLGKELVLYSELLMDKQEHLLQKMLSLVQPSFFILIALCIVAAYMSLLLPIYHMIEIV
ncbi:competence type IV pilus assembly protein ComGB [Lysinibacillus sp. FSL K6-0232]|uniref:competence type IV pilus assembly protein ComGB n=1 Tax=unclassified Lysinibacillus TaxID=2636778 RepID=UPI0030FD1E6B